jgi:hypothetical protein
MSALVMILALFLPPCAAEDSHNCYWDAQHRGNGLGTSFVDLGGVTFR